MEVIVKLKHLRIAPRKSRLVADLIRGRTVIEAERQLQFARKKAARPFLKLLYSGIATAENDFGFKKENLRIKEVRVDEGPTLKRVRPRARGAFYGIAKRTSHLVLGLEEIEKTKSKQALKAKEKKMPAKSARIRRSKVKDETRTKKKSLKKAPRERNVKLKGGKKIGVFRRKAF